MTTRSFIAVGVALALGACASTPKSYATLDRAQAAVSSAAADQNVAQYAPVDLEAAKKHLARAEEAAHRHHERAVDEEAYLAAQIAHLAQLRAQTRAYDVRVAQARRERDRIELEARARRTQAALLAAQQAERARGEAEQETLRLQDEIQRLKATPTPRGLLLTLGDLMFDSGRAELNPRASTKLDQLAEFLNEHPERRVQIDGFTDSTGSTAFNEQLSQRRAQAVKAALVVRGVEPARVSTEGYGSAYPVASNNDPGGRQLNRRVEVVIGNGEEQPIAPRG